MDWIVVYDYLASPPSSSGYYLFALLIPIVWILDAIKRARGTRGISLKGFRGCMMVIAVVLIPIISVGEGRSLAEDRATVIAAYTAGNYKVVEGPVGNFVPMPSDRDGSESFTIDSVGFMYSETDRTHEGFRYTRIHGGPIEQGKLLRVTYILDDYGRNAEPRNIILKIEEGQVLLHGSKDQIGVARFPAE